MSWQPAEETRERSSLGQVLEDAMGRRALVAMRLLLDSSRSRTAELAAYDARLTGIIVETLRRLGLTPHDVN